MIGCWDQIRRDYITTDVSQRALAQSYGVSVRQISRKSRQEGWLLLKQQYFQEKVNRENGFSDCSSIEKCMDGCPQVDEKKNEENCGNNREKTVEISMLTEKLCQKANIAIDRLEGDGLDTQKLRQLVQSVKDLKELMRAEEESNDTGQLEKLIQGLCDL